MERKTMSGLDTSPELQAHQPGLPMFSGPSSLPGAKAPRAPRSGRREGTGRKVALVVEDDPDAASVAASMLQILGFQVELAVDAQQALMSLSASTPDLVMLDICLPDLDGSAILRIMRRLDEHSTTPVLAVSAVYPENNKLAKAMKEQGVLDYLPKPFTFSQLRKAVQPVLGENWGGRPKERVAPSLTPADSEELTGAAAAAVSMSGLRAIHVGAEAHIGGAVIKAVLQEADEFTVTVQLDKKVKVGAAIDLRVFAIGDERQPRLRLLTEVEVVLSKWKKRYRLKVEAAAPKAAWDELRVTLGRFLGEAETGEWKLH
jgi:DNA-binding response OmpR family regulator